MIITSTPGVEKYLDFYAGHEAIGKSYLKYEYTHCGYLITSRSKTGLDMQ
jgi:hypothetical protein